MCERMSEPVSEFLNKCVNVNDNMVQQLLCQALNSIYPDFSQLETHKSEVLMHPILEVGLASELVSKWFIE